MKNYAVVRTDNLRGTYVGSALVSFRFHDAEGKEAALENGNVITLAAKMPEISRDMWKGVAPAAGEKLGKLCLVAGVELVYEDNDADLDDFRNEAGSDVRGYVLHSGDEFSVTKEALQGEPDEATNKYIEVQAGTKWLVSASAGNAVAELEAIESESGYTYHVYRVL